MSITPAHAEQIISSASGEEVIPAPGDKSQITNIYVANTDSSNAALLMIGGDVLAYIPAGEKVTFSGLNVREAIKAQHDGTSVDNLHVTAW